MLEDVHFNFSDSVEEDGNRVRSDSPRTTSPDNFGSLFAEFIADSMIDSNCDNMSDLLADSDINDCEIEGYLVTRREKSKKEKASKITSHEGALRPKMQPLPVSTTNDNENFRSLINEKTGSWKCNNEPKINISHLEERGKCTNRNALNARLNRMRKKQYISELETKVESLTREKNDISEQLCIKVGKLEEANKEITYLRSVISNQKGLMSLLGNISNTAGVKLNTSLVFTNDDNGHVKSSNTNKKRHFSDNDSNKSVSVKRTRNGLYMVNNKDVKNTPSLTSMANKQHPAREEGIDVDVQILEPNTSSSQYSTSAKARHKISC